MQRFIQEIWYLNCSLSICLFFNWRCMWWIMWQIFRLTCQSMVWTQRIELWCTGLLPISHVFRGVILWRYIFSSLPTRNLKLRDIKFHFKVALWKYLLLILFIWLLNFRCIEGMYLMAVIYNFNLYFVVFLWYFMVYNFLIQAIWNCVICFIFCYIIWIVSFCLVLSVLVYYTSVTSFISDCPATVLI